MDSGGISNQNFEDEQKLIVKFLTLSNEKNPTKIYRRLAYVYKKNVVSLNKVIKWWKNDKGFDEEITNAKSTVTLKTAKDPWRRTKLGELEMQPKDNFEKQIKGTLNKLSEKNIIIHQKLLLSLPIDTEQSLRSVVQVILTYVCIEHKYANLYALLCKFLTSKYVPHEKQIIGACPMNLTFGEVLSSSCMSLLQLKLAEIKSVPYESSEMLRYKLKGLNIFMAEIYKLNLISPHILHEYLQLLLDEKNKNLYTIECCCVCLSKVGKYLEDECKKIPPSFKKENLDDYLNKIKSFSKNEFKELPYRIYFMLLDLIELATERNWVPRFPKIIRSNFVRKFTFRRFNLRKENVNKNMLETGESKSKKKKRRRRNMVQLEERANNLGSPKSFKVTRIKQSSDESTEEDKLFWKLLRIMNKMTDRNINVLLAQLNDLPIEKYLNKVIDIITYKAIKEPLYCHLYANLCWFISTEIIKEQNNASLQVPAKLMPNQFRELLLTKCHSMWQEKISQNLESSKLEEELFKNKLMSKGLAKFITELYKIGMLSSEKIYYYLDSIISERSPTLSNIELFCIFLTFVGPYLEKENKNNVDNYFSFVKSLYEKTPRNPYRIWFQLLDLIELRDRNWLPKKPVEIVTSNKRRDSKIKNKTRKVKTTNENKKEYVKESNLHTNLRLTDINKENKIEGGANSSTENTTEGNMSTVFDRGAVTANVIRPLVAAESNEEVTNSDKISLAATTFPKKLNTFEPNEICSFNQNQVAEESEIPVLNKPSSANQLAEEENQK